jgi:hypothetical protein
MVWKITMDQKISHGDYLKKSPLERGFRGVFFVFAQHTPAFGHPSEEGN